MLAQMSEPRDRFAAAGKQEELHGAFSCCYVFLASSDGGDKCQNCDWEEKDHLHPHSFCPVWVTAKYRV
jgi:hypothetical protein